MWIVLLCVGVAAIMKGKELLSESKSIPQTPPSTPEREEIERRIKEILGVPEPEKRVVPPVASRPMPQPRTVVPSSTSKPAHHPFAQTATVAQSAMHAATQKPKAHNESASSQVVGNHGLGDTISAQQSVAPSARIEAVIDDFSLEKAVIYAEILQPKFKEY